jgi:hypothetical protein
MLRAQDNIQRSAPDAITAPKLVMPQCKRGVMPMYALDAPRAAQHQRHLQDTEASGIPASSKRKDCPSQPRTTLAEIFPPFLFLSPFHFTRMMLWFAMPVPPANQRTAAIGHLTRSDSRHRPERTTTPDHQLQEPHPESVCSTQPPQRLQSTSPQHSSPAVQLDPCPMDRGLLRSRQGQGRAHAQPT